ncbi:hypothetical protein PYCC9005_000587 [Savitreella phatthalungensis]
MRAVYGRHKRSHTTVGTSELLWDEAMSSPGNASKHIIFHDVASIETSSRNEVNSPIRAVLSTLSAAAINFVPRNLFSPRGTAKDKPCNQKEDDDLGALQHQLAQLSVNQPTAWEPLVLQETVELSVLLDYVKQEQPLDFEQYAESLDRISKLGEASYAEVFQHNRSILKVIPFGKGIADIPVRDILQEIRCAQTVASIEGFVKVEYVRIVRGVFPDKLLAAWDDYAKARGTENERPTYGAHSLFAVIALEHGGTDLERFELASWQQALDILLGVVRALATAEERHQFEHRDLHWGNVLVTDDSSVRPIIIDYTLSRCSPADGLSRVAHNSFRDEALFEADGEVDYQFDIYRYMRDARHVLGSPVQDDWVSFTPVTNVLWVHYLVDKLLYHKKLRAPKGGKGHRRARSTGDALNQSLIAYKRLKHIHQLIDIRRYTDASELPQNCRELLLSLDA